MIAWMLGAIHVLGPMIAWMCRKRVKIRDFSSNSYHDINSVWLRIIVYMLVSCNTSEMISFSMKYDFNLIGSRELGSWCRGSWDPSSFPPLRTKWWRKSWIQLLFRLRVILDEIRNQSFKIRLLTSKVHRTMINGNLFINRSLQETEYSDCKLQVIFTRASSKSIYDLRKIRLVPDQADR